MDSPTVSQNFSIAKACSIIIVVASHWFADFPLWIPATVALFVFGFSSSFFTARIYGTMVDTPTFWKKKVSRLGIRYWLILAALSLLLTLQDKDILHWHSLVHFLGMSGILNLFGPSASELGRGLWFFTLLLLFYVLYPLLAKLLISGKRASVVLAAFVVVLLVVNENVKLGFSLWLTMLGFVIGVFVGGKSLRLMVGRQQVLVLASAAALVVSNAVFHYREFNGVLLFIFSLALALWLTVAQCVRWKSLQILGGLEKCLLEIYLIHSYLFVRPTGISAADFGISLGLIIVAALALNTVGNALVARVFQGAVTARPRPLAIE